MIFKGLSFVLRQFRLTGEAVGAQNRVGRDNLRALKERVSAATTRRVQTHHTD
jgi:hypothetical protein